MLPQHISQEVGIENQGSSEKFCFLPLPSRCYFILLLPHVKDSQRHEILMWPDVSHIAFCCEGASDFWSYLLERHMEKCCSHAKHVCMFVCLISHTKGKSCLFITEGLLTVRARYYSIPRHILISAIALHSVCHPVSLPPLHPSSSQVGIHHHVGGQLTSDSFVNVNYCSLSEPRESGTCRPVRRRLRRSQNNQPMCLDSLSRPLAHANMQI